MDAINLHRRPLLELLPDLDPVAFAKFTIPGKPVAWMRVTGITKRHKPKELVDWYERVRSNFTAWVYESDARKFMTFPHAGPVGLALTAYLPAAEELMQTRPEAIRGGSLPCDQVPDLDNIEKGIGDALEGYAWVNDRQIVSLTGLKLWTAPGDERLEIVIAFYPEITLK